MSPLRQEISGTTAANERLRTLHRKMNLYGVSLYHEGELLSMSNEALAVMTKEGDTNAAAKLWENCRRLLQTLAWRYYNAHTVALSVTGVELGDLDQECYFVMLDAVEAFSPEKEYCFVTYLSFHAQKRFDKLCGLRGIREPLNDGERLETPVGDEADGMTLGDVTADPNAIAALDNIAEIDERERIAQDVRTAVKRLAKVDQMVIRMKYYHGADYAQIAEILGESEEQIQKIHKYALQKLRKDHLIRVAAERLGILQPYTYVQYTYSGSLERFRQTFSSAVESAALKLVEKYAFEGKPNERA